MAPRWQELLVRHKGLAISAHDKGIDNTHWVALANVVVDHLKQKRSLRPIRFSKRPRDNHRVLRPTGIFHTASLLVPLPQAFGSPHHYSPTRDSPIVLVDVRFEVRAAFSEPTRTVASLVRHSPLRLNFIGHGSL
jgi:hypothetical protein